MSRWRIGLGAGVVVVLVVAAWAAVSSIGKEVPTTVTSSPTITTTSTTVPPATAVATTHPTTPTTSAPSPDTTSHAEARTEEVRLILEDLYFRWFDAIYHNDEEAVRKVVATERRLANFRRAVDELDLPTPPGRYDIVVSRVEVLRDSPDCLVTFSEVDQTMWRGPGMRSSIVDVLWAHEDHWRFATSWQNRGDLWEGDCDASRSDELP